MKEYLRIEMFSTEYQAYIKDESSKLSLDLTKVKKLSPEGQFSFWMKKCSDIEAQEIEVICQDELDECRKQAANYRKLAWAALGNK